MWVKIFIRFFYNFFSTCVAEILYGTLRIGDGTPRTRLDPAIVRPCRPSAPNSRRPHIAPLSPLARELMTILRSYSFDRLRTINLAIEVRATVDDRAFSTTIHCIVFENTPLSEVHDQNKRSQIGLTFIKTSCRV